MANQKRDSAQENVHEIRNYLTSILSNLSLAKQRVTEQDELFNLLHEAEQAALRASRLCQDSNSGQPPSERSSKTQQHTESSKGRVLVVDDEEQVRKSTSRILSHLNYEVEVANDGPSAVSMYKDALSQGRRFDAVIIDLSMPGGLDGAETLNKLKAEDAAVSAVAASGYLHDPVLENYEEHGFRGVIMKPFRIAELQEAMQKALD